MEVQVDSSIGPTGDSRLEACGVTEAGWVLEAGAGWKHHEVEGEFPAQVVRLDRLDCCSSCGIKLLSLGVSRPGPHLWIGCCSMPEG